ncbi:MAG: hypothetical protein P4L35_12880 [Ignavibacteriaceae bacterium]|nr:hypothetical protein [Ignavibacteriaceae bacterium]
MAILGDLSLKENNNDIVEENNIYIKPANVRTKIYQVPDFYYFLFGASTFDMLKHPDTVNITMILPLNIYRN